MSRIFRNSEPSEAHLWLQKKAEAPKFSGLMSKQEANRIVSMANTIDEDSLHAEMDVIEQRASKGTPYYYNVKWSDSVVSKLKEFASASNCKIAPVDPDDEAIRSFATITDPETQAAIKSAKSSTGMQKLASASGVVAERETLQIVLDDPFHLDTIGNMDHMAKADWQVVAQEAKMSAPSVFLGSNAVIKIGGGEDYNVCSHHTIKPGQNSVMSPKAIDNMVKDNTESAAQKTRKANTDREMERAAEKKDREAGVMALAKQAQKANAKHGSVFATETMYANSGVGRSSAQLDLMNKGKQAIPTLTAGEKLADENKKLAASIQRPKVSDKSWDAAKGAARPEISDDFFNALKDRMDKSAAKKK